MISGRGIVLDFDTSASESDVEQAFIWPLLTDERYLAIPSSAIRTKFSIASILIDKGSKSKRYVPDYLVYIQGLPILVIEAKAPGQDLGEAFREAQLYAHTLNARWATGINPVRFVAATDGRTIVYGLWDSAEADSQTVAELLPGSQALGHLTAHLGWNSVDAFAYDIVKKVTPSKFSAAYEYLGESTVRLSKIPNNPLSEALIPVIQKYFQSDNPDFEDEIIERAYVSSDETTRYQRLIEDFLREKVAPLSDASARELSPTRRDEPALTGLIDQLSRSRSSSGHLQLVIGGVGSGKSTFLKRYFRRLISPVVKANLVVVPLDFNEMPDDLSEVNRWVAESFVASVFASNSQTVNREDPESLRRIFAKEIKDNAGAYKFLKDAGIAKYNERLGNDLLNWMNDPIVFARALARHIGGDKGKYIVVIFDNVDRRDRESQLSIFQTSQWFRRLTQSLLILCLRDETYETYKNEPPLDAFINTLHFYIRPPRFVDMVKKRLDLAIEYIGDDGVVIPTFDVAGVGRVTLQHDIGEYLRALYVDLFQKQRRTTVILEGLSGRNVRRALEMFSNVLVSGHVELSNLAATMATGGTSPIPETSLIRALMRTNYLYFYDGHGFVRNVFDFSPGAKRPNHFLKLELADFLIRHRKQIGNARYEGYYSVEFLVRRFAELGFPEEDVLSTLEMMLNQGLILADHLRSSGLKEGDLVRIHASGFVHLRVLGARIDYIASCALTTPLSRELQSREIARHWQIRSPRADIGRRSKLLVSQLFKSYLESEYRVFCEASPFFAGESLGTINALRQMDDAIGFTTGASSDLGRPQDLFD